MNLAKEVRLACKMDCLGTADCRLQACTSSVLPFLKVIRPKHSIMFSLASGNSFLCTSDHNIRDIIAKFVKTYVCILIAPSGGMGVEVA
ncbi:unnamed protein product [Rodentolepis nana]|uniref:Tubulin_C domain-containing protein n=1 Tax=Rodentolepis nana TaxID=102285 RepID=A0A0R3TZH3_RODNA|nr:unnamed protein product [Rodentolepis nana]